MPDVIGDVGGRERPSVIGVRQHLAADALHRHERVANDAPFGGHAFLVAFLVGPALISQLFGLGIRRAQVPRQLLERIERCDRHDVALAHRSFRHELGVGTVAAEIVRAMPFDPTLRAVVGKQLVHVALGVDLVDEQIGVLRGAHLDADFVSGTEDRVVAAIGPHVDRESPRFSRTRQCREQNQRERDEACLASVHGQVLRGLGPGERPGRV